MRTLLASIFLMIIFAETTVVMAATYHVAITGSDAATGTAEQPFLTIQRGLNTAQPGDMVLVGAGTYSQDLRTARSGTANAPITLDGQGVATVRSVSVEHQYIHLQNFTVAGRTNRFSSLLYMARGAHHCVISNNIVDGNFTPSIFMLNWSTPTNLPFGDEAASDALVVSNTFTHGFGSPVVSVFGDRNVIRGNRLVDSAVVDWFRLWGRSNHIVANLCANNFVAAVGNHADFIQTFGNNGHGSRGQIIESNLVVASHGDAQLCMLTADGVPEIRDWTFRNNIFVGVSAKGTITFSHVNFYNNLFVRCSTNPLTAGHVLIFTTLASGDAANSCQVFNNVFLDCGDSRTSVGWYSFAKGLTNVAADYNYVGKLAYKPVVVDSQRRVIGDPRGWDSTLWWEPHGINGGDPFFVGESKLDFRLRELSRLIGAALPLNQLFTTDMLGTARGAQWDIGPIEFQAGETPARPLAPTNLRTSSP